MGKSQRKPRTKKEPENQEWVDRIHRVLATKRHIEQKAMFGGIAFLLCGNLVVAIWMGGLIARIGPIGAKWALDQPYVSPFAPSGKGPMKGWVVIHPDGFSSTPDLEKWILLAVDFVESLPIKPGSEEPIEQWVERSLRYA